MSASKNKIALVCGDSAFGQEIAELFSRSCGSHLEFMQANVRDIVQAPQLGAVDLLIVELDATNRDELIALQGIMMRYPGTLPVVVLCDSFDEAVGRWFLQIRVSDFLRRPYSAADVVQACTNVLGGPSGVAMRQSEVLSFSPAAGGVGNTTLAIETAIQFARGGANGPNSACIVDLDFQNDACASHLDVEPRLDLAEVGASGERLDEQLLEVMGSRHQSGLVLFGATMARGFEVSISDELVLKLLDAVAQRFSTVVIDMPRTWQSWTRDVLRGSDRVYVVTDMTVPGLRCARRIVQRIEANLGPDSRPMVIVNRAEKQGLFSSGLRKADVERVLDRNLAGTVGNNYALVREAIDRGVPLETIKQGNNVSADLRRIVFAA